MATMADVPWQPPTSFNDASKANHNPKPNVSYARALKQGAAASSDQHLNVKTLYPPKINRQKSQRKPRTSWNQNRSSGRPVNTRLSSRSAALSGRQQSASQQGLQRRQPTDDRANLARNVSDEKSISQHAHINRANNVETCALRQQMQSRTEPASKPVHSLPVEPATIQVLPSDLKTPMVPTNSQPATASVPSAPHIMSKPAIVQSPGAKSKPGTRQLPITLKTHTVLPPRMADSIQATTMPQPMKSKLINTVPLPVVSTKLQRAIVQPSVANSKQATSSLPESFMSATSTMPLSPSANSKPASAIQPCLPPAENSKPAGTCTQQPKNTDAVPPPMAYSNVVTVALNTMISSTTSLPVASTKEAPMVNSKVSSPTASLKPATIPPLTKPSQRPLYYGRSSLFYRSSHVAQRPTRESVLSVNYRQKYKSLLELEQQEHRKRLAERLVTRWFSLGNSSGGCECDIC